MKYLLLLITMMITLVSGNELNGFGDIKWGDSHDVVMAKAKAKFNNCKKVNYDVYCEEVNIFELKSSIYLKIDPDIGFYKTKVYFSSLEDLNEDFDQIRSHIANDYGKPYTSCYVYNEDGDINNCHEIPSDEIISSKFAKITSIWRIKNTLKLEMRPINGIIKNILTLEYKSPTKVIKKVSLR